MSLFWVAKINDDGETTYFLQEATTQLYASLRASIAEQKGNPVESIELDAKTARKVPKKMIGRVLSQSEAEALLARFGGEKKNPATGSGRAWRLGLVAAGFQRGPFGASRDSPSTKTRGRAALSHGGPALEPRATFRILPSHRRPQCVTVGVHHHDNHDGRYTRPAHVLRRLAQQCAL